jgi:hypothetical protein
MENKKVINEKEVLNEDWIENTLMALGFVPVVGELFDFILIVKYILKKEYFYATLMVVALFPIVGDLIAKPFILGLKALRGGVGKLALRNADDMAKVLVENPKLLAQYDKIIKSFANPNFYKFAKQLEEIPKIGPKLANGLREGVRKHRAAITNAKKMKSGKKTSTKPDVETSAPPKVSTPKSVSGAIEGYFQNRALRRYIEKNGKEPATWFSRWWNVTYRGRRDRRNIVKYAITTSGILSFFGLPSFESFKDKIENDENFRNELANRPEMAGVVEQTTNSNDLKLIDGQGDVTPSQDQKVSGGGNFMDLLAMGGLGAAFTGQKGLNLLRGLAQRV